MTFKLARRISGEHDLEVGGPVAELSLCVTVKNRSRLSTEHGTLELFPDLVDSLLAALRPEDDAELVVTDWGSTDWPLEEWLDARSAWLPVQLVKIHHKRGFSRGLGLNVAAQHASSRLLCFLDADMLIPRTLITEGRRAVKAGVVYAPVCTYYLDRLHDRSFWADGGYGCCMLTREMLDSVGGWPVYWQWGFADTHLIQLLSQQYRVNRMRVEGFVHQWHPPTCERARLRGQEGAALDENL